MPAASGSEHERLGVLVGTWKTEGWTAETEGNPFDATDTYEWLPGRCGLLHLVDARMGEDSVLGGEVIGFDPGRDTYVTQYFGTDGASSYEASLDEEEGVLTWRMRSANDRFTGTFSDDRNTITGHWERLADGSWRPRMDITLTKRADPGSALRAAARSQDLSVVCAAGRRIGSWSIFARTPPPAPPRGCAGPWPRRRSGTSSAARIRP